MQRSQHSLVADRDGGEHVWPTDTLYLSPFGVTLPSLSVTFNTSEPHVDAAGHHSRARYAASGS